MSDLENRRLLVLGGTLSTCDVVKTAKKMGVHVTVTDYLEGGVSKELADEIAGVSTADMDGLAELVRERNIDGVFTGASEFNIRNMIQLCQKVGLPVYISLDQWNLCSDKKRFKQACRQYGVPVVPEYDSETAEDIPEGEYPLIVKPADSYSGNGISVCRTKQELPPALRKAKKTSRSGRVVIEKFMQGDNVEVYYLVQNGKVMLLSAADRYTNKEQNGSPVPVAFYHPSRYLERYLEEVDPKVRSMFEALGVKNGVFFMESFTVGGEFFFYEMGLRLNATQEYHFIDHFNRFNPLEMMIRYALTGSMGEDVSDRNDPRFPGKACEIALLLRPGTIRRIEGMDAVRRMENYIYDIQFYQEGESLVRTGSLDQNFARIKVVAGTGEELEQAIEKVYAAVSVTDEHGNEMLIGREREEACLI